MPSKPLKEVKRMGKTKAEEMFEIFRQLSPLNQSYFVEMVRVAEVAEGNGKKAETLSGGTVAADNVSVG